MLSFDEYFPVSALTGEGVDVLVEAIVGRLPYGPAFYPRDSVADRPEMNANLRGDFKRDSRVVERLIRYYGARVAREEAAQARRLAVG